MGRSIFDEPIISFGREVCGDPAASLRREWLVTNGIGGYASQTLIGVSTRSYHGLLVAALEPPVARTVLVGGNVEWVVCNGRRYPLATNQYGDGVLEPEGFVHLAEFRLDGTLPIWTFEIADVLLERRVWMEHGANTTYVAYRHLRGSSPIELEITPLVTYRDFHVLTSGQGWQMQVESQERSATDRAFAGATPLRLLADSGEFRPGGRWYWNFHYRDETARGLNDHGDLYAPGMFLASLEPGQLLTVVYSAEEDASLDGATSLASEQARQRALIERAGAKEEEPVVQQLTLAADQFIVRRAGQRPGSETGTEKTDHIEAGKTIIAGYHWFNDWGRDTMISLPGLTLATRRAGDAADILRTMASYLQDGLLPNNFPDHTGVIPGYNTADATLWFVLAVHAYGERTGDTEVIADLLPVLHEIVQRHIDGTRYGIAVDPADGLLRAGEAGVQLTWMDAKVSDWVVTPRTGKPIEINALWYNVLRILAGEMKSSDPAEATRLNARADRVRESFVARFVDRGRGYLADVIDGPDGDDWSLRPNQVFAMSLPFPLIEGDDARMALDAIARALVTTHGLRSLAPDDRAYRADYAGDTLRRDGAYHQGTVWNWLLPAYAEARARLSENPGMALDLLRPIVHHLRDAGLGSISEIGDGDAPHHPRGAIAQAWSVAEYLRVWQKLSRHPG